MPLNCWNQTMWRRKLYRYEVALHNKNIFQLLCSDMFCPAKQSGRIQSRDCAEFLLGFYFQTKTFIVLSALLWHRWEVWGTDDQVSDSEPHQRPSASSPGHSLSQDFNSCLNRKSSCITAQPSSALMCCLKTQKEMDLVRLISTIQTLNETNKQTNEQ